MHQVVVVSAVAHRMASPKRRALYPEEIGVVVLTDTPLLNNSLKQHEPRESCVSVLDAHLCSNSSIHNNARAFSSGWSLQEPADVRDQG